MFQCDSICVVAGTTSVVVFGFIFGGVVFRGVIFGDVSVSVGTGPTVKRREKYCHMQPIQCKAPHTKLHALPDLLDSVFEFKFVRMFQGSGKQYWEIIQWQNYRLQQIIRPQCTTPCLVKSISNHFFCKGRKL